PTSTQTLSVVKSKTFDIDAVDSTDNTISVPAHGFADGDKVKYFANGNTPITGLSEGTIYTVQLVDDGSFHLLDSGGNVVAVSQGGALGTQYFARVTDVASYTADADNPVIFGGVFNIASHGFIDGDKVLYLADGGPISGLTSGTTYTVGVVDQDHFL